MKKKIKLTESKLIKIIQKIIKEQKVFWPDDEGTPVPMGGDTPSKGNIPELHRGFEIELIKPRVKDWWRAEEHLWDMGIDYDKFNREESGVTFLMKDTPLAFYDKNQKTLIIYR